MFSCLNVDDDDHHDDGDDGDTRESDKIDSKEIRIIKKFLRTKIIDKS